ncbi:hypothetical protein AYO45_02105 [Gammaproteobacteria bacterium SCGC AG-212-F23]|nr:hypothetical protein AYO45_02105 [Gammaproteobacteria bacterium SCGC AG-212-F23]
MKDIFSHIIKVSSQYSAHHTRLNAAYLDTPLGPMIAIADETALYLLEFMDRKAFEQKIIRFLQKTKSKLITEITKPIGSIREELINYFNGTLKNFKTPIHYLGSPFQQKVWQALTKISYGKTKSYLQLAETIGKPTAFRAVAQANSTNPLAIIVPCHRVINANGNLGGYAAGIIRKKWLLEHEAKI